MTVYECRCGFTSGTAVGFQRHIARYKGEVGKHRMVSRPKPPSKPSSKPLNEPDAQTEVEASRPSERSWLSGLLSSEAATPVTSQTDAVPSAAISEDASLRPDPGAAEQTKMQTMDKVEASSSGGESAWEKVSSFVDSGEETTSATDEYAALTAQLAASGPAAGTRARTRRPTSVVRKSKLAPCKSAQNSEAGEVVIPGSKAAEASTAADVAQAAVPPSPERAASQTLSEARLAAGHSMERLASASKALPPDPVSLRPKLQGSDNDDEMEAARDVDAGASPTASTSATLHTQQAAEASVSGVPVTEAPQHEAQAASSPQHQRLDIDSSSGPVHTSSPTQPPSTMHSPSPAKEDALHHHGQQLMRRSIGVVTWLKASADAALTLQPASAQSIHALEQRNTCSAEDVEAVLLWQEPMRSSKYFLGGMYILICLRQLVLGVELLQPSTALAGVLLALLLGNTVRVAVMCPLNTHPPRRELALQAQITQAVAKRGAQVASLLGAIAVLIHRRLSGHDRTGTTVWLALTLWSIMALGETALVSQSSMSMAVWCAIFGLPTLYLQCRHILDVLVEEALQLVAAFLRAGQRGTVMFAGGVGLVVMMAIPLSLFARLSLAVLTVGNILFWKACMPSVRPAVTSQVW